MVSQLIRFYQSKELLANTYNSCSHNKHYHTLSKKSDLKLLKSLISQPSTPNMQWREVERLLQQLGAELQEGRGSRVKITLDERSLVFHKPHGFKGMGKARVETIRDFILAAGVKIPED